MNRTLTPNRPAASSGFHGEDADERAERDVERQINREKTWQAFEEPRHYDDPT